MDCAWRSIVSLWRKKVQPTLWVAPALASVTQGRLRCTCQPCAIESITAMGMGTPRGLVEMGRGGLHMDGWFPLGGLCANGYLVCVGCAEKYDGDW